MTSSASSTYFQGGDYVELLSAQGKAPAATWKLHGKILKSFEKAIKGNAFQLDGSTETKMQLPKTATTTTQSLGLSQRFLVFQLSIPFTRSLSIEIGFSDFQKIRRRFVFASAFRETAMTSLHVQIPFDARVTRDQWINLVFDLQALTETYFAGSTFRSMESICISGSCKLKRVFTMKDAPVCDLAALQHQQQVANGKLTQRRAVGLGLVAGYTDMKDIPKQFLFSSGGPGPIPTEYFVVATISNAAVVAHGEAKESGSGHHATSSTSSTSGGRHTNGSMGQARGKSAPLGAQKQKPLLVKKASSTRPVSSSSVATTRPKTEPPRAPIRSEVQAASPLPSPLSSPVAREKDQSRRSLSSSAPSRSVDSPLQQPLKRPGTAADSTGRGVTSHIRLSNDQPPRESSARPPLSSNKREVSQHEDHLLQPGHDAHLRTSTKKNMNFEKRSPRNQFSDDDEMELTPYAQASRSSSSSSSSSAAMEPRNLHRSSSESKTNKEVHRRAIIAEIQQKLDILSDDDELEAERNTMLFLERTSLIIAPDSPQELPVKTTQQVGDKTQAGDESVEQELLVDLQPRRLRSSGRKLKTKSIFAFADDSDEDGGGGGGKLSEKLEMKKRITKLFDFESLLDSPMSTQRDASTSEQVLQKSSSSNSNFKTRDGYSTSEEVLVSTVRNGSSTLSEDEEEDQALAQLLIAKRNARRQQQQLVTVAPEKIMQQPTKLREVPRNSRADQQRLSVDDLTQEEAQDEELNGGAQDEEEEEEENLSIDLTGDLDNDDGEEEEEPSEDRRTTSAQSSSGAEEDRADGDNDDKSFDFDDLVDDKEDNEGDDRVEDEKGQRSPVMPQKSNNFVVDTANNFSQKRSSRTGTKKQQDQREDDLAFSTSPPRKSLLVSSNHQYVPPRELSLSSSRRLASLLESTDWSQLQQPDQSSSYGKNETNPETSQRAGALGDQGCTREPPATAKSAPATDKTPATTASIELIYDPLLNCYFDPVANKYYALASQ